MKSTTIKENIYLKPITEINDLEIIINYYRKNQKHLAPSMPLFPENFFQNEFWIDRMDKFHEEQFKTAFRYVLECNGNVIGHVFIDNIIRGPFQAGYMGYGIDKTFEGNGLVTSSIKVLRDYLFFEENINRIMANCMPSNFRSMRILNNLEFNLEGLAKKYLKIQGKWEDHVLFSCINLDN